MDMDTLTKQKNQKTAAIKKCEYRLQHHFRVANSGESGSVDS